MDPLAPNSARLATVVAIRHDATANGRERLDRIHAVTKCIESLAASRSQNERAGNGKWGQIDIVIVDDHSIVPVERALDPVLLDQIRIIQNGGAKGQGGALNFGLRNVQADVYAFTDSDCIVASDWYSSMSAYYQMHPRQIGVAGPNWDFQEPQDHWSRLLTEQESRLMRHVFENYVDHARSCSGRIDCRNLSLRSSMLDRFYPERQFFSEKKGPSVSGQTTHELLNTLGAAQFGFCPQMRAFHQPVQNLTILVSTYFRRGRRGDFHRIYRVGFDGLRAAFLQRYWRRHFIAPILKGGVAVVYVAIVHGAFWSGIFARAGSDS